MPEKEYSLTPDVSGSSVYDVLKSVGLDLKQLSDRAGEKMRFWSIKMRTVKDDSIPQLEPTFSSQEANDSFSQLREGAAGNVPNGISVLESMLKANPLVVFTSQKNGAPTKPVLLTFNPKNKKVEANYIEEKPPKSFWQRLGEKIGNFFKSKATLKAEEQAKKALQNFGDKLKDTLEPSIKFVGALSGQPLNSDDYSIIENTAGMTSNMGVLSTIKHNSSPENSVNRVVAALTLKLTMDHPETMVRNVERYRKLPMLLSESKTVKKLAELSVEEMKTLMDTPREFAKVEKSLEQEYSKVMQSTNRTALPQTNTPTVAVSTKVDKPASRSLV